jgi:hypothetical protein
MTPNKKKIRWRSLVPLLIGIVLLILSCSNAYIAWSGRIPWLIGGN